MGYIMKAILDYFFDDIGSLFDERRVVIWQLDGL